MDYYYGSGTCKFLEWHMFLSWKRKKKGIENLKVHRTLNIELRTTRIYEIWEISKWIYFDRKSDLLFEWLELSVIKNSLFFLIEIDFAS